MCIPYSNPNSLLRHPKLHRGTGHKRTGWHQEENTNLALPLLRPPTRAKKGIAREKEKGYGLLALDKWKWKHAPPTSWLNDKAL